MLGFLLLLVAVSRIAFGVPWTLAGGGAGGPLFGQALGTLVALGVTAWVMRAYVLRRGTGRRPRASSIAGSPDPGRRRRLHRVRADLATSTCCWPSCSLAHSAGDVRGARTDREDHHLPARRDRRGDGAERRKARHSRAQRRRGAPLRRTARRRATTCWSPCPRRSRRALSCATMFGHRIPGATHGVLPIVLAGAALALLYLLVVYTVAIQDRRWVWLLAAASCSRSPRFRASTPRRPRSRPCRPRSSRWSLVVNELRSTRSCAPSAASCHGSPIGGPGSRRRIAA